MGSTAVLNGGVDALLSDIAAGSGPGCAVIDLGGGTGGQAVRLASLGHRVTVVDPSPNALAALARRADDAGVADLLQGVQGDAEGLVDLVEPGSVDLVLCHGVLEIVDDPRQALAGMHRVLRPGGRLSLVVHQREAAVLGRVAAGQIRAAAAILTSDSGCWGPGDPLRRRFSWTEVAELLGDAGFTVLARDGLRIFTDVAPTAAIAADRGAEQLLDELELQATGIAALRDVAGELHIRAQRD